MDITASAHLGTTTRIAKTVSLDHLHSATFYVFLNTQKSMNAKALPAQMVEHALTK